MGDIPCYQVDAFSERPFAGNPAAVCPLRAWLPDALLQQIAAENNVSETAFFVPRGDDFDLRWFTPEVEVDLCGHATLASAFVLMTELEPQRERVRFHSRSGALDVVRHGGRYTLDFPARSPSPAGVLPGLVEALRLDGPPREVWRARDLMVVLERADDVRALAPDMALVAALDTFAIIVTAPGGGSDDDACPELLPTGR